MRSAEQKAKGNERINVMTRTMAVVVLAAVALAGCVPVALRAGEAGPAAFQDDVAFLK